MRRSANAFSERADKLRDGHSQEWKVSMETTADVLKNALSKRKQATPHRVFQEVADIFVALRLLIVADRIEGAEKARMLRRD